MSEVELGNGVTLTGAGGHAVRSNMGGRRGGAAESFSGDDLAFSIDTALRDTKFELAVDATIEPASVASGRRGFREIEEAETPGLSVEVGPDDDAVLLLETVDGVYHWQFPEEHGEPEGASRRGGSARILTFALVPEGDGRPASGRRGVGDVASWLGNKLISPIRVRVLRFLAAKTIDAAVERIEGDVTEQLLALDKSTLRWAPVRAMPDVSASQSPRILLLVHGTFSSTEGSFSALHATAQGRQFLTAVASKYDAIVSFDHKTLAVDPDKNAEQIQAAIGSLPQGAKIDAIAFSRGGLVYRALAKRLADTVGHDVLGKAVFVGCTNSGTLLAEPDNWDDLVDLYTNIGLAGARALGFLGSPVAGRIAAEAIRLIGGFVQALPHEGIRQGRVPGLLAMRPSGSFVQDINSWPAPIEDYHAVVSDFEPRLDRRRGLNAGMVQFLADRVLDRLMREDNDLVVHTGSMSRFGDDLEIPEDRVRRFGPADAVYHVIYFQTERLAQWLMEWLIGEPEQQGARRAPDYDPFAEEELAGVEDFGVGAPAPIPDFTDYASSAPPPHYSDVDGAAPSYGRRSLPPLPVGRSPGTTKRTASRKPPRPRGAAIEPPPAAVAAAGPPEDSEAEFEPVECHFAAEMNPTPRLGITPLIVTISRQALRVAMHDAARTSDEGAKADPRLPIEVNVMALENCRVWQRGPDTDQDDNGSSVSVMTAVPDDTEVLRFVVEGAELGLARLQIEITQGPVGLASFVLAPVFVDPDMHRLTVEQVSTPIQPSDDYPAVLRIYEQNVPGVGLVIKYDLACNKPRLAIKEDVILPSTFSVEAFSAQFLQALDDAWRLSEKGYKNFLERISSFSVNRTNELLPPGIRQALWDNWDKLGAIQVFAENPYIPWELLYVEDPSGQAFRENGFLAERGLIRWVYNAPLPGDVISVGGDRVHYVIPDYLEPSQRLANAAQEKAVIDDIFAGAQELDATSAHVKEFLRNSAVDADILHFVCHGNTEHKSVLSADLHMRGTKGANGEIIPDYLSVDTVKRFARFRDDDGSSALVFVNACKTGQTGASIAGVSGFADSFLRPNSRKGAAAFVGALWSVDDKLALNFSKSFYEAMVNDELTLVEAAKQARKAAQDRSDFTWLAYTIYGNPAARIKRR